MTDQGGVVQVDIFGSQYTIKKGSEDSEYIARVAAYVDQKMREINERSEQRLAERERERKLRRDR